MASLFDGALQQYGLLAPWDPRYQSQYGQPSQPGMLPGSYNQQLQAPPLPQQQLQAPQGPVQAPQGGGGIAGAFGQLFGGVDDPRLTPEENAQARNQALAQSGLATIIAAQESGASGLGSIAQGAMFGQQTGQANRERIYGRTAEARLQAALQDPSVIGNLPPEVARYIQFLPPAEALKVLGEYFKPQDLLNVPEGNRVWNPNKQRFEAFNPDAAGSELSADMRNVLWSMGIAPDTATREQQEAAWERYGESLKAGRVIRTESEQFGQGLTEFENSEYNRVQQAAANAESSRANAGLMRQLLDGGLSLGGWTAATLGLRQYLTQFGIGDPTKLGEQELFDALANAVVPGIREQMGNMGQLSDRDLQFLLAQVPSLRKTPQSNAILVEIIRRSAQRAIDIQALMDQYMADHNNSLRGWQTFRRKWVDANDIYADLIPTGQEGWGGRVPE